MKLIKPSYTIETPINGEEILIAIERAGRTAYKSEGKIEYKPSYRTENDGSHTLLELGAIAKSARPFVQKLIRNGHEAVLELGGMINVRFICDRGVSHEIVRHRLASFVQESTRYCNYANGKDIEFIIPCWTNITANNTTIHDENDKLTNSEKEWLCVMDNAEESYLEMIKDGWSPQQARSVLPNSLKTEIVVGANIREWRHIFKLRTANGAHPQMVELMRPLLKEFQEKIPIIFDDITY